MAQFTPSKSVLTQEDQKQLSSIQADDFCKQMQISPEQNNTNKDRNSLEEQLYKQAQQDISYFTPFKVKNLIGLYSDETLWTKDPFGLKDDYPKPGNLFENEYHNRIYKVVGSKTEVASQLYQPFHQQVVENCLIDEIEIFEIEDGDNSYEERVNYSINIEQFNLNCSKDPFSYSSQTFAEQLVQSNIIDPSQNFNNFTKKIFKSSINTPFITLEQSSLVNHLFVNHNLLLQNKENEYPLGSVIENENIYEHYNWNQFQHLNKNLHLKNEQNEQSYNSIKEEQQADQTFTNSQVHAPFIIPEAPICLKAVESSLMNSQIKIEDTKQEYNHTESSKRKYSKISQKEMSNIQYSKTPCKCRKSQCLKLYCECFSHGEICGEKCCCFECRNSIKYLSLRNQALKSIEKKGNVLPLIQFEQEEKEKAKNSTKEQDQKKGCNCKKSRCIQKYCECFFLGKSCSETCQCLNCQNLSSALKK